MKDYPSQLAQTLDIPVVNYGVSGFDPYQSALLMKQKLPLHPKLEIAVLGIMYENIRRLRTSYRFVMQYSGHSVFMYKPWLDVIDGKVVVFENPNKHIVQSEEELEKLAMSAIRNDYYAPEPLRFPYVARLLSALMKKSIQLRFLELFRPMYKQYYFDVEYRQIMIHAIHHFIQQTNNAGLQPLVVFLPNNRRDITSPDSMVIEINDYYGKNYVYNAGNMKIDWNLYNLRPGECHPSEYGHQSLANYLLPLLPDTGNLSIPRNVSRY